MRLAALLVAIITCVALTACGGSSHSSTTQATGTPATGTQATGTPAASAQTTPAATATAAATTTTTTTSAPPEVPKAKKEAHHGGTRAASQGAHVETRITLAANGDVSPPAVSVPSGVGVELRITNHGSRPATVVLSVPSHPSIHVAPGAGGTLQTGGLKNGTYRILVNGTPRGQLMIGAEGGP